MSQHDNTIAMKSNKIPWLLFNDYRYTSASQAPRI